MTGKFPRNHKFSLGDRLQNQLSDLLEMYIQAYYLPPGEKQKILQKTNIHLQIIRYYYRLCYELGLFPSTKYQYFAEKIDEIGKMTGGWLKSLSDKNPKTL